MHYWRSGGVSSLTGNPKQIYVLRGGADLKNFAPITALHLDAKNAANFLLATRLELRPKDVIFVGTQPITNWNRMLNQIIPSLGLRNLNIPSLNDDFNSCQIGVRYSASLGYDRYYGGEI